MLNHTFENVDCLRLSKQLPLCVHKLHMRIQISCVYFWPMSYTDEYGTVLLQGKGKVMSSIWSWNKMTVSSTPSQCWLTASCHAAPISSQWPARGYVNTQAQGEAVNCRQAGQTDLEMHREPKGRWLWRQLSTVMAKMLGSRVRRLLWQMNEWER